MRMVWTIVWFLGCIAVGGTVCAADAASADDKLFSARVAPLLTAHCVRCHNDSEKKGDLSLQSREAAFAGGYIVAGEPAESHLLQAVTARGDQPAAMPKNAPALSVAEVDVLRQWIAGGAPWPEGFVVPEPVVESLDWWSFQPLARPVPPATMPADAAFVRNPIDAFVLAELRARQLSPSPEADRRTLYRRLSYDLWGLPPDPAEVAAFVADEAPDAYERLVDRLLAAPAYGERWARHWLDVVHYGETHGYDKDQPRPNAWPYRDYVIRALNDDRPYGRFVQEQLAGDVLFPGTVDGQVGLGFVAAGPWDLIGHAEVPETKIDGQVARHLDRDDMVQNTIGTFLSLTVGCAQCHHHKFDPITQDDYYRLQAVFAAVDRADQRYYPDAALQARFAALEHRQKWLEARRGQLQGIFASKGGAELAELDRQIAEASRPAGARPEFGYHSAIMPRQDETKWVQVDLGEVQQIDQIKVAPCHDDFNGIGAGFGFPLRYRIEISADPAFVSGVTVAVDRTAADQPNPGIQVQLFKLAEGTAGRYVRLTATRLAPRSNDYILALSELLACDAAGKNLAAGAKVAALDTIEAAPRWRAANLTDGIYPALGSAAAEQTLDSLRARRAALLERTVEAELRQEATQIDTELDAIRNELKTFPAPSVAYRAGVHFGSGAFAGTGAAGGKPRPIRVLSRGDVKRPGAEVLPGALRVSQNLSGEFSLPADHAEGERRAALARWISDPRHPLTWRSIANRLWQYHFGRGLVDTPNDFGRMGQLPTHPELLDWLAATLRDEGQSWKQMHRLMVTSGTYRQSSVGRPECESVDASNAYLWRFNRRKLEAESVRDAVLAVAGRLDHTMGGPSYRDFVIEHPAHSPHYEYHLHDPEDAATHRRSIYRFIVRSQPQPFMTTLDCADPSLRVDKRSESLSPLQSLAMLNNGFMLAMSRHAARQLQAESSAPAAQARRLFALALARDPTAEEQAVLAQYVTEHGLENAARLVFNLNEFTFVD